ncbi:hypothetical protein M8C21_032136, partial [Ambrosia artemisiifolia]
MARTMGRGSFAASGRGAGGGFGQDEVQAGERGVGRGSSQGNGEVGDQTVWRSGSRVVVRGGGHAGYRGVQRGGGDQAGDRGVGDDESVYHVMNSPIESSAGDDESTFHVAPVRRGSASQVQVPEPINQSRLDLDCRRRMHFQWEKKHNAQIYRYREKFIAVRDVAKAIAEQKHIEVGDDMSVLINFKPPWIKSETWEQRVNHWNTPEWKAKLRYLGVNCQLSAHEMWKQSHCKKGRKPLDKDPSCSSSLLLDVDSEGDVQAENLVLVDDRAEETWNYGKEHSKHPKFDEDLWSRAVGKNKGKVYGLGSVSDPCVHDREDP